LKVKLLPDVSLVPLDAAMVRPDWNACRLAGLCLCIIRAHATLRRRRLRHRGGAHIAVGCAPDSCLIGLRLGLFATPPSHFGHSGGCSGSHVPAFVCPPEALDCRGWPGPLSTLSIPFHSIQLPIGISALAGYQGSASPPATQHHRPLSILL